MLVVDMKMNSDVYKYRAMVVYNATYSYHDDGGPIEILMKKQDFIR